MLGCSRTMAIAAHGLHQIPQGEQARTKRRFAKNLGADAKVAVGTGLNRDLNPNAACLGLAVVQAEGAHPTTIEPDAVFPSVLDVRVPVRLVATVSDQLSWLSAASRRAALR